MHEIPLIKLAVLLVRVNKQAYPRYYRKNKEEITDIQSIVAQQTLY